jgi:hypothetical protein
MTGAFAWIEIILLLGIGIGIFVLIQKMEKVRIGKVNFDSEPKSEELEKDKKE